MKITLTALLLLFTFAAFAQPSSEQKKALFNKSDSLVVNYIKYSTFLIPGQNNVSTTSLNRYRQLFTADAQVPDEMMIGYFLGDTINKNRILITDLNTYLNHVQSNYPEGLNVKLLNANVNYNEIDRGIVKVVLEKVAEGFNKNGFSIQNHSTVVLSLKVSNNFSNVQISGIEPIAQTVKVLNDMDNDYVVDSKDNCPTKPGPVKLNGCPPKGPSHVWGTIGLHAGVLNGNITEGSVTGANLNVSPVTLKNGKSIGGNILLEYYFGSKMNFGLGSGIALNKLSGTLSKEMFHAEFSTTDKWGNPYRQIISSVGSLEEEVSITSLSIPVLLIYKTDINAKLGFRLDAGIIYNLGYKATTDNNTGLFDYEAIYRYDNAGQAIEVTGQPQTTDWLITQGQGVEANYPSTQTYFENMQGWGYPVGLGAGTENVLTPNTGTSYNGGLGILFRPSLVYKISPDFAFNFGIYYSSSNFTNKEVSLLVDEKQNYNGMYNSFSKVGHSNFGIALSLTHSLF